MSPEQRLHRHRASRHVSVQPNVFLRLPVFTPMRRGGKEGHVIEADEREGEFLNSEGYFLAKVQGRKLNMTTDFPIWCELIYQINKHKNKATFTISFKDFAKAVGISSKRLDRRLRERFEASFARIRGNTLILQKKNSNRKIICGFVSSFILDGDTDEISIEPDSNLWDIYEEDLASFVKLRQLSKINGEIAKSLYIYITSLPSAENFRSLTSIKKRLDLNTIDKEQNRKIREAINHLNDIGFIKSSIDGIGKNAVLTIYEKNTTTW